MKRPVFDPAWSEEVQAVYRHDMREIWDSGIEPHIFNQYQNQLALYRELVRDHTSGEPARILDVGCAQATLAMQLAEAGHHVVALDLRPDFIDYAKTRYTHGDIQFLTGNVFELALDERFDVVFANQLIEHIVYPLQMIERLKALLSLGGILVTTTPNWRYRVNSLPSFEELGDVTQYEDKQFTADGDGHFFAYRADELRRLFQSAGLHNIRAQFFETPFISGHMKVRFIHGLVPPKILRALDRILLATPGLRSVLAHQLLVVGERRD